MNRYKKYILAIALIFMFSACSEEFLDYIPEDQATVGSWYRDADEIRQATASMYGRPWFSYNDVFQWCAGDVMAGDVHHNWDQEGQFFYISYNENNNHIAGGWEGLYNVISYANLIMDDMPVVANGYGVTEADINAGLAEARFMRAAAYFQLAEYWGDVPILERPAEKVAANDLQLPKNTVSSIYEFIRRDLEFAAENLPASDDPGRVTKWSAYGMLAKLHVTLGQRAAGGSSIGSLNDFTVAANYAKKVIDESGISLGAAGSYEDLFMVDNEHDPRVLFALQWINAGYGVGNPRMTRYARHTKLTGGAAWGGGKCVTENYIENLENNAESQDDLRRRAIYMQLGDFYDYLVTSEEGYLYEIVSRDVEGVQVEGSTPLLNSLKKYVIGSVDDTGYDVTNQDSPMDTYMLRLADVYLLYAEALLADGDQLTSGPGYEAYLAVRERAGLNPPADGNMTYEDLFNERRVEFGLESQSWLDVKRRYYRNSAEALDYLNSQVRTARYYRINSSDGLENDPAGYELVPPGGERTERGDNGEILYNTDPAVSFNDARMMLPIPGEEVVANPLLRADVEPVDYVFE